MVEKRVTPQILRTMKESGEKIAVLTAYDYPVARIMDDAGVDVVLVGDSMGTVVMGESNTLPVTMEDMIHHTSAVSRAARRAMVVGDMPFMSYQLSPEQAAANAGRLVKVARAHAVKLEGGAEFVPHVEAVVRCGIPVMGHIGFGPQSILAAGGFKIAAKSEEGQKRLIADATALEAAGVFAIVLECVPPHAAAQVTAEVTVPTIGIGAGPECDGQVLVSSDMLGLYQEYLGFKPRFVKSYADVGEIYRQAFRRYCEEVKNGQFPTKEYTYE